MNSSLYSGMDALGHVTPRKPPIQPGDVTNRKELADAIGHIMRGMSSPIGGPSRKDRIEQILAGCDALNVTAVADERHRIRKLADEYRVFVPGATIPGRSDRAKPGFWFADLIGEDPS